MKDKVLVIGPSWVGDMILAQSLFMLMKQRQPDIEIHVAAPAWTLPLLERMPEVAKGIPLPFRHGKLDLLERFRIGRGLRAHAYSQAILLTNSLKSALVPYFANIPRRTGFLGEKRYGLLNDIRPLDIQRLPMTVQRFAALGLAQDEALPLPPPLPRLRSESSLAMDALARLGLAAPQTPVLGLCPGAEYGSAKRWPEAHYAVVAQWALAQGWAVWLFGSAKDTPVTNAINRMTENRCLDLGGRTRLAEAIDLMSLTCAVVSNDSGLMHLAAALDRPLVAVYGSSDPHHTPPMSSQAKVMYLGLSCSPCFKRECPLGHLKCLRDIAPDQVISSLRELLQVGFDIVTP
jgi:heptosyltransferase-2